MTESFLHGVEVVEIDDGSRTISTVSSSIIGVIGTAPRADATAFPLNTPVLISNSRVAAAKLLANTGSEDGTLPSAIDSIFDQTGAVIIVVRVDKGTTDAQTMANIIGGVNASTGAYTGMYNFLAARSTLGYSPRILLAPGYTHQSTTGVGSVTVSAGGTGYTSAPTVTITGANGNTTARGTATVSGGAVTGVTITNAGNNITAPVSVSFSGGGGSGATATAAIVTVSNPVVAELTGIADRLRAVIIADGPNTSDTAAIQYAAQWGSRRIYVVDPWVLKSNANGTISVYPPSACVAGVLARVDNDRGFWWSPSNNVINGIVGISRPIDFSLGDANCAANLLNGANVATIIREDGFRLWGNRTTADDSKWKYLSVVRTADIINDSLQRAHRWAVDRNITKNYVSEVIEGVNNYLRHLKTLGAIINGSCWADKDLNTPDQIADGRVYFDFDFTPPFPAEHITFRSHMVNDYLTEIFA